MKEKKEKKGYLNYCEGKGVLNTGQSDALESQFHLHHGKIGFGKKAISRLLTKEVKKVVRGSRGGDDGLTLFLPSLYVPHVTSEGRCERR